MATALESITCLIVDDEPLARTRLRSLIKEVDWLQCLGEAGSGRTAISAVEELAPDLLFLDIRLPGESGIEILRRMTRPPAVMFTTAYDEYALTAFELGAIDYLLKPFGRERFNKAMDRARPMLELKAGADAAARAREVLGSERVTRLFVRDGGRIVPLMARSIERIEACDDYVVVYRSVTHLPPESATVGARVAARSRSIRAHPSIAHRQPRQRYVDCTPTTDRDSRSPFEAGRRSSRAGSAPGCCASSFRAGAPATVASDPIHRRA